MEPSSSDHIPSAPAKDTYWYTEATKSGTPVLIVYKTESLATRRKGAFFRSSVDNGVATLAKDSATPYALGISAKTLSQGDQRGIVVGASLIRRHKERDPSIPSRVSRFLEAFPNMEHPATRSLLRRATERLARSGDYDEKVCPDGVEDPLQREEFEKKVAACVTRYVRVVLNSLVQQSGGPAIVVARLSPELLERSTVPGSVFQDRDLEEMELEDTDVQGPEAWAEAFQNTWKDKKDGLFEGDPDAVAAVTSRYTRPTIAYSASLRRVPEHERQDRSFGPLISPDGQTVMTPIILKPRIRALVAKEETAESLDDIDRLLSSFDKSEFKDEVRELCQQAVEDAERSNTAVVSSVLTGDHSALNALYRKWDVSWEKVIKKYWDEKFPERNKDDDPDFVAYTGECMRLVQPSETDPFMLWTQPEPLCGPV